MNIHDFLDEHHVRYETIVYPRSFDGRPDVQLEEDTGEIVAKAVLLKCDQAYLLAIVPASHIVDLAGVRALFRDDNLEFASWGEIFEQVPEAENDRLLPFGSRYGMTTLVDESVSEARDILFDDSTHNETIRMRFVDYFDLEKPVVTRLSYPDTC
jgi:Ala-tRNA(Pro) deacylase